VTASDADCPISDSSGCSLRQRRCWFWLNRGRTQFPCGCQQDSKDKQAGDGEDGEASEEKHKRTGSAFTGGAVGEIYPDHAKPGGDEMIHIPKTMVRLATKNTAKRRTLKEGRNQAQNSADFGLLKPAQAAAKIPQQDRNAATNPAMIKNRIFIGSVELIILLVSDCDSSEVNELLWQFHGECDSASATETE
jgi:hypothetical protein